MKNKWTSLKSAARNMTRQQVSAITRAFGASVQVKLFEVVVDREDDTGKLTFKTVLVRKRRKKLADLIAVKVRGVWKYFTDELHAVKAFFGELKISTV